MRIDDSNKLNTTNIINCGISLDYMDSSHAEYYRSLPTIHVGQSDDLKLEDSLTRIWVSRCESSEIDGGDLVTVENLIDGRWVTVKTF